MINARFFKILGKNMVGAVAKNAQEGTRSEYLAQFFFSAFGTAIPVPHPEDSGIDLYCTLGRRIGRRFFVENYYQVQIKSHKEDIIHEGKEEVEWLLSHKYPFLICFIDKKSLKIEVFQTLPLSLIFGKVDISRIRITHEIPSGDDYFHLNIIDNSYTLFLGNPIISIDLEYLEKDKYKTLLTQTLKSWIEIDQENIDLRQTGASFFRVTDKWKTNEPLLSLTLKGNFKYAFENEALRVKNNDLLLRILATQINHYASQGKKDEVIEIINFVMFYSHINELNESFGTVAFNFCAHSALEHLGIEEKINIFKRKVSS